MRENSRAALPRGLGLLLVPLAAYFLYAHAVPRLAMTEAGYGEYYWDRRWWLLGHTVAGLLATLLGPLQFVARFRAKRPDLHRLTGQVYLLSVLVAAACAVVLAFTSAISTSYAAGLLLGASLWIATGGIAYAAARRRDFATHRAWMIRNYAVTFFFIVFFAAYDAAAGLGHTDVVALAGPLVFACLLAPLAVVELALRGSHQRAPERHVRR
jgi:uncharacterized membrane protein